MLNYVQAPVMTPVCSREAQHIAKRTVVSRNLGPIVQFGFHGYLFFASVVKIVEGVQKDVYVRKLGSVPNKQKYLPICASPHDSTVECLDGSPAPNTNILPTKYVVMNFTRVTGMDATAARGAFLILKKYCRNQGISVVFANVLPKIRNLLLKNGVASKESFMLVWTQLSNSVKVTSLHAVIARVINSLNTIYLI
ncbi:hypothetical protein JG688_00007155 [Phytophthora aleatoria]|uniref:STAS domain-containing protein n=1 Tax=Phytophthora aleatoria TaxID=2496075 RepID=A0A8J5M6I9_9STRA|nr:hypothetical protein JG688_00007155 [Phytophthora aleatoria]